MKWFASVLALCLATAFGAIASGSIAFQYLVGWRPGFSGSIVLGHLYEPELHGSPIDWLELRQRQLSRESVYLRTPDEVIEYRYEDLGIALDAPRTALGMANRVREGGYFERMGLALRARRGLLVEKPVVSVDRERARRVLESLAPRVARAAVNARLDVDLHRRVESSSGRSLDIEGTLQALERAAEDQAALGETPVVAAHLFEIAPEVTSDMLLDIDVTKVLARFETDFRTKAGPRAINIRRAAAYLDGTILAPGAVLSFNQIVGPREESRGFVEAPVIVNDELESGVGGGVCQVATTLYAASVYGLLGVKERRSHSRPSGYAPLGLDAAVIYGKVDLKLENPYDTPLMVHAFLPSRYKLRVELLGRDPPGDVKHVYAVTEKYDFTRRVASKSFLLPGEQRRRQKGTPGYDVVSVVSVHYVDGTESRRSYRSKYYPVPEVYWVSEGSDMSELPELPEGASHTELVGDGDDEGSDEAEVDRGALRG